METIFMNTKNSKANEPHRFKLDLADKVNLKNPNKNMALANLSIYYTWKNIKSEYKIINLRLQHQLGMILDLHDGSYSIDVIQDYFEFIIKKHETLAEDPPFEIFKIKAGYKLELLTPKTMRLLGSTKKVVGKDKNGEIVPN